MHILFYELYAYHIIIALLLLLLILAVLFIHLEDIEVC